MVKLNRDRRQQPRDVGKHDFLIKADDILAERLSRKAHSEGQATDMMLPPGGGGRNQQAAKQNRTSELL